MLKGKATFQINQDKPDLITQFLEEIADAPARKVKKLVDSNTRLKKEQFKRRFKYLNEKVSVVQYPKDNNIGNSD